MKYSTYCIILQILLKIINQNEKDKKYIQDSLMPEKVDKSSRYIINPFIFRST